MSEVVGQFSQIAFVETYTDQRSGLTKVRDSFQVCPSNEWLFYRTVDLGSPEVASSIQKKPETDGTLDQTKWYGGRLITITGVILDNAYGDTPRLSGWDTSVSWNSAPWMVSYLSGWASPRRRFGLYLTDQDGRSRVMYVRGDQLLAPVEMTGRTNRLFSLGLYCASGKILSFHTGENTTSDGRRKVTIRQTATATTGRAYPETGPYLRNYPEPQSGAAEIFYEGSVPNGFVVDIYTKGSTMTQPRISVTGPDGVVQSMGLSGYTIPAGAVVRFDTVERTATMRLVADDSGTLTNLSQYLAAPLVWPTLIPGTNRLAGASDVARLPGYNKVDFVLTAGDSAAYAEILYNDADLA